MVRGGRNPAPRLPAGPDGRVSRRPNAGYGKPQMKVLAALFVSGSLFSVAASAAAAADRPVLINSYSEWTRICFTTSERVINVPKPRGQIRDLNKAMTAEKETNEDPAGLARRAPRVFASI